MNKRIQKHGGDIVAEILKRNGVKWIFTLCGGHISPILTGCNSRNIHVIDVRHESTAVFAADAVSRISSQIGVAAVTAGPGLTNTITAIKNAQMAQVPILIISGATPTVLKNRGSLQDINHLSIVKSITKYSKSIKSVRRIEPVLEKAINYANSNTPGPVYIEIPVDLLYPESIVREWYGLKSNNQSMPWWISFYLNWNVNRIFKSNKTKYIETYKEPTNGNLKDDILKTDRIVSKSKKPILLFGSQVMNQQNQIRPLIDSIEKFNIPIFVSGMARGLMSKKNLPIFRHQRTLSLKEADVVILVGVPCDFRLDYGRSINHNAKIISINLSKKDAFLNRKPHHAIITNPNKFIIEWSKSKNTSYKQNWKNWYQTLLKRDEEKKSNIKLQSELNTQFVNPIKLFLKLNSYIKKDDIIIADGGDFVATASYILRPRAVNGWLDPGVFGTLGVGAGFILGSKLVNNKSTIWAIFGDGAFGYSLMEFDSFVRHNIPVIAIIGNDAGWTQISRDQVEILNDPISTELTYTNYHKAVESLGGKGYYIDDINDLDDTLIKAKKTAKMGKPVAINIKIGKTEFRKGSISM